MASGSFSCVPRVFSIVVIGAALWHSVAKADYQAGLNAYGRGDYAAAAREFKSSAEDGHAESQWALGVIYTNGLGVRKDCSEALSWFRKAAEQGFWRGQLNLGKQHGLAWAEYCGTAPDYAQAVYWFRRAADQGEAEAHNELAWLLATVAEVRDPEAAIYHASRALEAEDLSLVQEAYYNDTLAAAYAAAGRFADAAAAEESAIMWAEISDDLNESDITDYEARLKLYRRGSPLTCPGGPCD